MKDTKPDLFHKIKDQKSILSLTVCDRHVYAGTQGGDLLVWSLSTFELLHELHAHRGSCLGLFISADCKLLFSSGGDAIVNVWCTRDFRRLYSIYSTYDVGDVFSVTYSARLQTVYLGAQNTSIQWYDLSKKDVKLPPDPTAHPNHRNDRFFDSKGADGISTPRSSSATDLRALGGQDLEISKGDIVQYAHFGYVYCVLLVDASTNKSEATEMLASGGGDGTIKLWSLDQRDGSIKDPVCLGEGDESVLSLAHDGSFLYSGRLGGDVNIWDLDARQMIRKLNTRSHDVLTLSVSYDLIFCGGSEGKAKVSSLTC